MKARGSEHLDEYKNWTGTAFRLERLRGNLAKFNSHDGKDHHDFETSLHEGKGILKKMAELQPHRLYEVSRWIKGRVDRNLNEDDKKYLSQTLGNLSMVESAFLNAREELLDKGILFDEAQLSMVVNGEKIDFYERAMPDEFDAEGKVTRDRSLDRERARRLAELVKLDFKKEFGKSDHANEYLKEFVYKREYTHGYILWAGDGPADEYNFSSLGATGSFVRRARDNANQAKAAAAEIGLLDNLKNIQSPKDLMDPMMEIFKNIDLYSRDMAEQAIADKVEGYIKFFKASWKTNIPFYKQIHPLIRNVPKIGGPLSYAKGEYGPHAPAWESSEIRLFIWELEHKKMITKEAAHRLMKISGATRTHVGGEWVSSGSQLLLMAMIFVLGDVAMKAAQDAQKEVA